MSKVVSAPAVEIEFKDVQMLRLNPSLAKEIGLNESIVFLQIQFWIKGSNNVRDGQRWTYQTLEKMHSDAFPFLSVPTIDRVIHSLVSKGLIVVGNYNARKSDRTRWFALNVENARKLSAIIISQNEKPFLKTINAFDQNEKSISQNETALPKDFPKTSHEIKSPAPQEDEKPSNYDEPYEIFKSGFYGKYGEVYSDKGGDWPNYNRFKKARSQPIESREWRLACDNFFASPENHTLRHFCSIYAQCKHGLTDGYGKLIKPIESPKPTASRDMAVHSTDKDIEELNVVWAEMKAKSAARIH